MVFINISLSLPPCVSPLSPTPSLSHQNLSIIIVLLIIILIMISMLDVMIPVVNFPIQIVA